MEYEVKISPAVRRMLAEMKGGFNLEKAGVWRVVTNIFTANVKRQFDAQGINPKWPALKDATRISKWSKFTKGGKKKKTAYKTANVGVQAGRLTRSRKKRTDLLKEHPILQLTGHLKKAASGSKAHGFRAVASKAHLTLAIQGIKYAARHNYGYKGGTGRGRAKTPQREFFKLCDESVMTEIEHGAHDQILRYFSEIGVEGINT